MLDKFESPDVELTQVGDAMTMYAVGSGYRAASPTDSDDPEDEIIDDEDLDDDEDDDDLFDDEDDLDDDDEDDLEDEELEELDLDEDEELR